VRILRAIFVACLLGFSLGGCSSMTDIFALFGGDGVTERAGLPSYQVGDSYSFGSPAVTWRVVAIDSERVTWRSDRGDEQVTGRNPLLPALEWRSDRLGQGRRLISDRTGSLFPLKVGARTTFKAAVTTDKPPYGWSFEWQCGVLDRQQVTGPTGVLDTYKIGCGRDTMEEMVFFYAPSIGHYVSKTSRSGGAAVVRHLMAYERRNAENELVRVSFANMPGPGTPEMAAPVRQAAATEAPQPVAEAPRRAAIVEITMLEPAAGEGEARRPLSALEQRAKQLLGQRKTRAEPVLKLRSDSAEPFLLAPEPVAPTVEKANTKGPPPAAQLAMKQCSARNETISAGQTGAAAEISAASEAQSLAEVGEERRRPINAAAAARVLLGRGDPAGQ